MLETKPKKRYAFILSQIEECGIDNDKLKYFDILHRELCGNNIKKLNKFIFSISSIAAALLITLTLHFYSTITLSNSEDEFVVLKTSIEKKEVEGERLNFKIEIKNNASEKKDVIIQIVLLFPSKDKNYEHHNIKHYTIENILPKQEVIISDAVEIRNEKKVKKKGKHYLLVKSQNAKVNQESFFVK